MPQPNKAPDPDAELMLRVKSGDLGAFEMLVDKYKQPIVNMMYRMMPDLSEAEDMAQNVFVRVFQSAGRYEVSARFSTWIFTIARHVCLNEIRRRSRHQAESMDGQPGEGEDTPARQFEDRHALAAPDLVMRDELEAKVQEALNRLPDKQRLAVVLCQRDELSYEEIAEVLELSLSATKSLIHRAREHLKQDLKPYLQTGEWAPDEGATLPLKPCLELE